MEALNAHGCKGGGISSPLCIFVHCMRASRHSSKSANSPLNCAPIILGEGGFLPSSELLCHLVIKRLKSVVRVNLEWVEISAYLIMCGV